LYEYIKYYRCTFPEAMKPSDEMITLYTDGELNEDAIDNLKKLHDSKPEASLDSASLFFWNLTEWAGCADLSFLDERQSKIVSLILISMKENIRMILWEGFKFKQDLGQILLSIDRYFLNPVEIINKDIQFNSWLLDIGANEGW
ncbi:MAG: hypothetical protein AABY22_07220, partial [Nanoarchaeota archaeon]